jgi:hypothetical protein
MEVSIPAKRMPAQAIVVFLWLMSLITFPVWTRYNTGGWDTGIYLKAATAVKAGHDPYADAIAVQELVHSRTPNEPSLNGPYSYVYSPITLPILKLVAFLPLWLSAAIYFLLYAAGALAEVWFAMRLMEPQEWTHLRFLAPVAVFFPGLLAADIILSGNVAYILYGSVLLTTAFAWKRGQWRWFYLTVLALSCVKAPLLSLLLIPILSARRQWLPVIATGAAGVALFAIQPLLWPSLFRNYLEAVELQFSLNRDFGFSPAGIFSGFLYDRHIPYSPASYFFYLAYAIPLLALLFSLSRRFLDGSFTLRQWAPVMLLGVILMNPRLIEYDVAPLALPLALILWRFLAPGRTLRGTVLAVSVVFGVLNVIAYENWNLWKLTEGPLLVAFFGAGCYTLLRVPALSPAVQPITYVQATVEEAPSL